MWRGKAGHWESAVSTRGNCTDRLTLSAPMPITQPPQICVNWSVSPLVCKDYLTDGTTVNEYRDALRTGLAPLAWMRLCTGSKGGFEEQSANMV